MFAFKGQELSQSIPTELLLKSNIAKTRSYMNSYAVVISYLSHVHITTESQPCFVQNLKKKWQGTWMLCTNEISRDLIITFVSYPILQHPPLYVYSSGVSSISIDISLRINGLALKKRKLLFWINHQFTLWFVLLIDLKLHTNISVTDALCRFIGWKPN